MKLADDIFSLPLIILLIHWLVKKVIGFIEMIFSKPPEWHDKHGKEYLAWKKNQSI